MIDVSRHLELFNPKEFNQPIHVIGAGATGSWLVLSLAKLGLTNIKVYDFDEVEAHNVANQLYGIEDIGCYKVMALQRIVKQLTGIEIKVDIKEIKQENFSGVVFMMIDTMSGRKNIYESSIRFKPSVSLMIEPRMGLHMCRVYNVNPMKLAQLKRYEDTLYSDEEAEVSACGNSMSVISSSLTVTGWCIRQLINYQAEYEMDNEIIVDYQNNNIVAYKW